LPSIFPLPLPFGAPRQASTDGFERGSIVHIAPVKTAAVVFQRQHERIELPPRIEIGGRQRGLNLPRAIDQHLKVVQPSEKLLRAAQLIEIGTRLHVICLGCQFERMPNWSLMLQFG